MLVKKKKIPKKTESYCMAVSQQEDHTVLTVAQILSLQHVFMHERFFSKRDVIDKWSHALNFLATPLPGSPEKTRTTENNLHNSYCQSFQVK